MEKFEYGDEKLRYERLKEKALEMGLKEYQIEASLIPMDFGLEINNNFFWYINDINIHEI